MHGDGAGPHLADLQQENARLRGEVDSLHEALTRGDEALATSEIRLKLAYLATIQALVRAIEAKDPYTVGHSAMVAKVAVAVSRQLGMTESERERVRIAATLMNIGKIGVPKEVLTKEGALDQTERTVLEKHVAFGAQIVEPVIYPWDIATLVYQSHERLDGTGYPEGVKGDDIDFDARIIGLCDTFVAMTADRVHRKAHDEEEVLRFFYGEVGKTFDEACVAALAQVLKGDEELRVALEHFKTTTLRSIED